MEIDVGFFFLLVKLRNCFFYWLMGTQENLPQNGFAAAVIVAVIDLEENEALSYIERFEVK